MNEGFCDMGGDVQKLGIDGAWNCVLTVCLLLGSVWVTGIFL